MHSREQKTSMVNELLSQGYDDIIRSNWLPPGHSQGYGSDKIAGSAVSDQMAEAQQLGMQAGSRISASGVLLQKARMKQQESDALFKIGHQMQQLERAGEQKTKADQDLLEALMTLLR